MNNTDAAQILFDIAIHGEKKYHPGYKWTVEYARKCKAFFSGVGIDEYLRRFARRESEDLFKQRQEITSHVASSFGAMLDRPFSKVSRSNWSKVVAFNNDQKGESARKFQREVLGGFSPSGLDGYVFERLRYWSKYDPNTFVAVEFQSTDGKRRAEPYPFEVTAEMAVDFRYTPNGDLEYLVVRQDQQRPSGKSMEKVSRFTMYRPAQTIVIQQLTSAEAKAIQLPPKGEIVPDGVANGDILYDGVKAYLVVIPIPHNYPRTPAVRVGHIENPADDGATRLSIFDAALPFAQKTLKANSEFDIVTAFLAFPVSVRYEDPCDEVGCNEGKLADGTTCSGCHGSGWKRRPTSAAEEILLPMPRRPEDMVDLTKILHYTYPPTDAVKMQLEMLQFFFQQGREAVFNSQLFSNQETAQTATYHGIALQSVYDTLYPYATDVLARCWKFLAETCAAFTGFDKGLTAMLIIPHDFGFETVEDLFSRLKMARDADASTDATAYLGEQIMEQVFIDDQDRLARWRVENALDPFKGMSEAQILVALNSGMVPEWQKLWWVNRQWLLAEILENDPRFYTLEPSKQRQAVRQRVDALKAQLDAERPAISLGAFGNQNAEQNAQ